MSAAQHTAGEMFVTTQATFFSPRAVLLTWIVSLCCILQGCAPVFMTAPSRSAADVATDSPGGIRVLGADQRFAAVSVQSVARRARTLRGEESISILALSGGGADGAFGAGALVGLTNAGARPQFSVVTGVTFQDPRRRVARQGCTTAPVPARLE